jgi:hypothetical protein
MSVLVEYDTASRRTSTEVKASKQKWRECCKR